MVDVVRWKRDVKRLTADARTVHSENHRRHESQSAYGEGLCELPFHGRREPAKMENEKRRKSDSDRGEDRRDDDDGVNGRA